MVKCVAVYEPPADKEQFDEYYRSTHLPLVRKMPGLKRLEVSRVFGAPMGEPLYHMMAEMYFEDRDAMFAALQSEEGQAAAKDVISFAGDVVHLMFADVED